MKIQFKSKNDKQVLAASYWIDTETEELLYGGSKGGGKSFLGCSLIFADALIYPETHYFIARKERIDLDNHTSPSIREVFNVWGLKFDDYISYNGQNHCYTLYNGSKIHMIACKKEPSDPLFERFGSMQMTRGWIEEAGEVDEAAQANLWLSIGRWKNDTYKLKKKLLITANPKKGWMKRDFVDPWKKGDLMNTRKFVQAFATDNKYLTLDYIDTLRNEKDISRRQRLFLGDWDYDEDKNSLVTYEALVDTFSNTITKDDEKYLTIDVARLGQDSTVFAFWEGLELVRIEKYSKQDTEKTKQQAKDYAKIERIPYSNIIIDEDGIGGALVDGMWGVRGFIANSSALPTASQIRQRISKFESPFVPKTNFINLKSQCAFKLAELINEHRISFNVINYRDVIIEELTALLRQKNVDSEGKLQIIPKDEVKQAISRSPDIGDSIIFRMFFELRKESRIGNFNTSEVVLEQKKIFAMNEEMNDNESTR